MAVRQALRRVAFVGVGRIGAPMAMRVARHGHAVQVK
jgi:3-hydroxyisobutyrate dehydrogenase-like beta-hydroxyacid dehydrogenase